MSSCQREVGKPKTVLRGESDLSAADRSVSVLKPLLGRAAAGGGTRVVAAEAAGVVMVVVVVVVAFNALRCPPMPGPRGLPPRNSYDIERPEALRGVASMPSDAPSDARASSPPA